MERSSLVDNAEDEEEEESAEMLMHVADDIIHSPFVSSMETGKTCEIAYKTNKGSKIC